MDHQSRMRSIRDAASLINSGGDMHAVLRHLVMAACRHANWAMGSIMGIDEPHGQAFVIVRHDPTMIQPQLPTRWELATSPAILALKRNEPVYIRDARVSEEFPGFRRAAFERDYHTVLVMPMSCVDEDGRPMVLTVTAREITEVTADDLAFLGTIVHLGEIAVEKQHRLRQERRAGERPQKALQAHTALLRKALAEASVAGLARMISDLLPNPTVVVDFAANVVVTGRSPSPAHFDDAAWQAAANAVLHRPIVKAARHAIDEPQGGLHPLFLDDGTRRLTLQAGIEPLVVDAQAVGALIVFPGSELDEDGLDPLLLDSAKLALSVQMMRNFIRFQFDARTLSDLFLELVERRWRDGDDMLRRAWRLEIDLAAPHRMIVVDFADEAQIDRASRLDPHHALLRFFRHAAIPAVVIAHAEGLVCLVTAEHCRDKPRTEKLLARVEAELRRCLDHAPVLALSDECRSLPDYAAAWEQCRRLIRIGRSFGVAGAIESRDFGPLPMLVSAADVSDVRKFVEDSIGPIAAHDREHGTPYLETLFAYLRQGCRNRACAAAMGLHVTTLRYRLSRIEELFGLRLDDEKQRFAIELAIRLREVMGGTVRAEPA